MTGTVSHVASKEEDMLLASFCEEETAEASLTSSTLAEWKASGTSGSSTGNNVRMGLV